MSGDFLAVQTVYVKWQEEEKLKKSENTHIYIVHYIVLYYLCKKILKDISYDKKHTKS